MSFEITDPRLSPGGSVSSGETVAITYTASGDNGTLSADYKGNGVTLNGSSGTILRAHQVKSSGTAISDSFTLAGSQGNHSISVIISGPDFGSGQEYSVDFYMA